MSSCLITGGAGNLACQLSQALCNRYNQIILFDIAPAPVGGIATNAIYERGDLLDGTRFEQLLASYRPRTVIHLASLLSGSCERDRALAWRVNMDGMFALLESVLRAGDIRVLFASSIAAYGGKLPAVLNDLTPQWPDGLYGVTKMAGERLGSYYHARHGLDFRCLRLPTTISRYAPQGAASAQASHAFVEVVKTGRFVFSCYPDTALVAVYVQDVLRAFDLLLQTPSARLTQRVYNVGAMTITPRQIAEAIKKRVPEASLEFEIDPPVAALLASWPSQVDDTAAARDWGWRAEFDLERTADHFLGELKAEMSRQAPDSMRGRK